MSEFMQEAASSASVGIPGPAADRLTEAILARFQSQQAHQWKIRQRPVTERVRKLKELKQAIVLHREQILDGMYADFRKNRSEAELSEIQLVFTELNEAIAKTPQWAKAVPVPSPVHLFGTRSEIRYQPRGVVLIMAAWNYPFALIFAPLIAAVAAGNCAMVRPSEKVPNTSRVSGKIVSEVFDPEEVALIEGNQATAELLLKLPFDHVFFTGSSPVGKRVMAAAATHLASVTLELGGKSPVIVDETADIPYAARCIVWGKFVNAGQTCVAPDYAFVHESKAGVFFDAARNALAASYGDTENQRQSSPDYCRMIDDANTQRVRRWMEEAIAAGAKIEAGGQVEPGERYIAPTILSAVQPESSLMQHEIFGPVLPVLTYRERDEIYRFLHSRPKPLALYIFSRDGGNVEELVDSTSAGGTVVNNCLMHLLNPNLPFGGAGESGFGSYHGRYGFQAFSQERAVLVQRRPRLSHLFYPPYARLKTGWLGSVLALARRLRD